jgi:hypothetical protein
MTAKCPLLRQERRETYNYIYKLHRHLSPAISGR